MGWGNSFVNPIFCLIMGGFRPEEVGRKHPLTAFHRQKQKEGHTQTLKLERLSLEAVSAWAAEMSGLPAARPLAARLFRGTEGNPFFLVEIVKNPFRDGCAAPGGGCLAGAVCPVG